MNCICIGNEKIELSKENVKWEQSGLVVRINGNGNTITIGEGCKFNDVLISISGNENSVLIGSVCSISNCKIMLGTPANKRKVKIGKKTYVGGALLAVTSHENILEIGEDCMFSNEIIVRTEDGHPIFDLETKDLCNKGGKVTIGNHCWIGERAYLLKGVVLSDNTIVGACSVVTKSFQEGNVVITGNPAQIVKKGIGWTKKYIHDYKKDS